MSGLRDKTRHAENAYAGGADIYLVSVAKTIIGVEAAHLRLAEIARTYRMTVLLANCVGTADGDICGGRSAVWNNKGQLLAQLDQINEALLIYDTETREVITDLVKL